MHIHRRELLGGLIASAVAPASALAAPMSAGSPVGRRAGAAVTVADVDGVASVAVFGAK